jgi:hypothetical protein
VDCELVQVAVALPQITGAYVSFLSAKHCFKYSIVQFQEMNIICRILDSSNGGYLLNIIQSATIHQSGYT